MLRMVPLPRKRGRMLGPLHHASHCRPSRFTPRVNGGRIRSQIIAEVGAAPHLPAGILSPYRDGERKASRPSPARIRPTFPATSPRGRASWAVSSRALLGELRGGRRVLLVDGADRRARPRCVSMRLRMRSISASVARISLASGSAAARRAAASRRRSAFEALSASRFSRRSPDDAGDQLAVVVEIAVIGVHRAVLDQPQPVGGGLEQMAVMRDQDDGAGKVVQRMDQRFAAVDVEMVGRLVEDEQVRPVEGGKPHQQPRLLAAGQILGGRVHLLGRQAELGDARRAPWIRAPPASAGGHARRRSRRACRSSSWCCAKIATFSPGATVMVPVSRLQPAGQQLGEGRLAVAVGAEQRDAVVGVDAQRHASSGSACPPVADIDACRAR